jgi:hypothetical protein
VAQAVTLIQPALATIDEFLNDVGTSDGFPGAVIALGEGSHAVHRALVMLGEVQAQIQTQITTTDLSCVAAARRPRHPSARTLFAIPSTRSMAKEQRR